MLTTIPPAAPGPTSAPGPLRNGNPRGNPNLAPRCGAKARTTGCPCQAPAMANGRCRMHGGNCRGPATPEGLARMTETNTKHGRFAAQARTRRRYIRTLITRTNLLAAARRLSPYLPPEMAARLAAGPQELATPIHPSNLPYLTKQELKLYRLTTLLAPTPAARRHSPTPTFRAAERLAAEAEAATQAPWRQAIASARAARRAHRAAKRAARAARAAARQARRENRQNHPTGRNAVHRETTAPAPGSHPKRQSNAAQRNAIHRENHAPAAGSRPSTTAPAAHATVCDLTHLERELAARRAGLRGPNQGHLQPEPGPAPSADFAPTGRNASHHEQPPASPAGAQTEPVERDAAHRERPTARPLTRLTPTKAQALRTTTLARTWDPPVTALLAAHGFRIGTSPKPHHGPRPAARAPSQP
jgi:hypothetical protein